MQPLIFFEALFILLTLIFPAWFSIRFRYLAWWVSQGCGIVFSWLSSGWRPAILLLISVASILKIIQIALNDGGQNITLNSTFNATLSGTLNGTLNGTLAIAPSGNLSDAITNSPPWWMDLLMPDFWMKVFAISALLILIRWAYKSRTRIAILQFSNLTGDDTLKSSAEGISSVLSNELARLVDLYLTVDETDPYGLAYQGMDSPGKDELSIHPMISSNVGEALKSAVTSDSKVKLGILEVPVGAIMGVLSMTVEGPRLTGGLHKEDDCLVIIAKISGGGLKGDWRVSSSEISEEIPKEGDRLSRMIRQLAYRIFTDLEREHIGTPRWRAVCHYTTGLRCYRDTLRTDRDKKPLLRQAERAFLLALGEDKEFLRCYYNLGVVYFALEEYESAYSVLSEAAEPKEPKDRLSNVYHAMAQNHLQIQEKMIGEKKKANKWEDVDYQFTLKLCDQAIKLQPDNVRAWNLKGFVKRRVKEQEVKGQLTTGKCQDYWRDEVVPFRGVATALAWREMCLCRLKGDEDVGHKKILLSASCTRNLAVALSYADLPAKNIMKIFLSLHISSYFGKLELCQSIHLTPNDADLYFELGKVLIDVGKYSEAAKCLEYALKINPKAVFWSYLAEAYSKQSLADSALYAYKRAVDNLSGINRETLERSKNVLDNLSNNKLDRDWYIVQVITRLYELYEVEYEIEGDSEDIRKLLKFMIKFDNDKHPPIKNLSRFMCGLEKVKFVKNYKCELGILISSPPNWGYALVFQKLRDIRGDKNKTSEMLNEAMLDFMKNETEDAYKIRLENLKSILSGWDWGYALALLKLADLESDSGKKVSKINEAVHHLEKDHPQETRKQGLHGKLAHALMSQTKPEYGRALYQAQRSVALDPRSSWDRGVLSEVYRGYQSFEEVNAQLKICLSIDPANLELLQKIAFSRPELGIGLRDIEKRQDALQKFVEILNRALELLQSDSIKREDESENSMKSRTWTHFWLGQAHYELGEFDNAIYNWTVAMNLTEKSDISSHLVAKYNLGSAYLANRSYNECEDLYTKLLRYVNDSHLPKLKEEKKDIYKDMTLQKMASLVEVGLELGFQKFSLGYMVSRSYLNMALSYAERDVYAERNEDFGYVLKIVEAAGNYIKELSMEDDSDKTYMKSRLYHCGGWILYKQAKLGDGSGIKKAIDSLEKAVCMRAEPEYYLHLAWALEYELETYGEDERKAGKAEFQRTLNRAFACCDHVEDLDLKKRYTRQAKDVRRRLRRIEKSHQKAIEANGSKPGPDPAYV